MANPYISLLSTAWKYARNEKQQYVLVYSLFILASCVFSLYPLLYGWFIGSLQKGGGDHLYYAGVYVGLYIFLKFIEWSFHWPARILERKLAFNLSRNFLQEMYHQTLHLPVKWHQYHHSGATINRIRKAYEALKEFFQNGFMYMYTLTKFFSSFIAILVFSPLFGSIGIMLGIFTMWLIFKLDKPFIKATDETNEKEHVLSATLFDSLSNIITVISLRLEKRIERSMLEKVMDIFPPFMRTVKINESKWFVADILVALIYGIVLFGFVYQNTLSGQAFILGSLVTLVGFINQFTSVFHDIAFQYNQIVQFDTNVKTARFIPEAYHKHHLPEEAKSIPVNWNIVSIKNLNFSYREVYSSGEKAHSLHNINIKIEKGRRIALIGESGSGKSTLMALLRGLYKSQPGIEIEIDNLQTLEINTLTNLITLFPQEPEIFENTIENNITLGLPFDEKEILEVCDVAHFTEVVQQLPNGLKSIINEKGVNLSGGQKQRLALARGILASKGSDIILLDEPTSNVDLNTEAKIYKKMFEAWKDKTIVSSLHRLHLLCYFDYIYILQNGRIVDEGNFMDLKTRSVIFGDLWKHLQDKSVEV